MKKKYLNKRNNSNSDASELTDVIDEFLDSKTVADVFNARRAIRHGSKGIDVSRLFNKKRISI